MNRRVLVCGGRDFNDRALVDLTLYSLHAATPISVIVHGGATGADTLARVWAYRNCVPAIDFPANWDADGKAAGPIRNAKMLKVGQPDLVVAFPGGRGTDDMIARAERAGVEVLRVGARA